MFGFLKEEAEELGSEGRFTKRIEKFRLRNEMDKTRWGYFRDRLKRYPEIKKEWEEQQRLITAGEEFEGRRFRSEPKEPTPPNCPTFRFFHPVIEHHFWWLVHNWLAHFMIGLIPIKVFFNFHDWTSKKLNAE